MMATITMTVTIFYMSTISLGVRIPSTSKICLDSVERANSNFLTGIGILFSMSLAKEPLARLSSVRISKHKRLLQ